MSDKDESEGSSPSLAVSLVENPASSTVYFFSKVLWIVANIPYRLMGYFRGVLFSLFSWFTWLSRNCSAVYMCSNLDRRHLLWLFSLLVPHWQCPWSTGCSFSCCPMCDGWGNTRLDTAEEFHLFSSKPNFPSSELSLQLVSYKCIRYRWPGLLFVLWDKGRLLGLMTPTFWGITAKYQDECIRATVPFAMPPKSCERWSCSVWIQMLFTHALHRQAEELQSWSLVQHVHWVQRSRQSFGAVC